MHFLIFFGALYFLPAIIAAIRHTHNSTGILLLNIFLGWTVVGWFVALLMALFSMPYYAYSYRRGW
ncbi:MAG: superinfection immunity protein [Terracidiphilus sp.]